MGEEAALGQETYLLSCVAQSNTIVLSINKNALKKISISNPHLTNGFYESLINHSLDNQLTKYKPIVQFPNKVSETNIKTTIGWSSAIFIPIFVFFITSRLTLGIPESIQLFLTIFSAALILWTFNLVSEFIPGIIIIFALLVLGIAPPSVVLSGFSSSSFFLALSIFALGAVLSASGLTYRLMLIILSESFDSNFFLMYFAGGCI